MTNKILLAKSLLFFIGGLLFLEKERDRLFNNVFWRQLKIKPRFLTADSRETNTRMPEE